MSVYLRTTDGRRILLDTSKCQLTFENTTYDLTNATLEFYDLHWKVVAGTVGSDETPCRVLNLRDSFTGLAAETPLTFSEADEIALGLANNGDRRRFRKLRKLLGT